MNSLFFTGVRSFDSITAPVVSSRCELRLVQTIYTIPIQLDRRGLQYREAQIYEAGQRKATRAQELEGGE